MQQDKKRPKEPEHNLRIEYKGLKIFSSGWLSYWIFAAIIAFIAYLTDLLPILD